ncbi:MAG: hypothetical protein QXR89_07290 [Candidatus Bathyarchaeia archaeon]
MLFDGLFEEHFKDLFGGKIVHVSFDCPENLRKAFNLVVKEKKESACKILQKYMALHVLKTTLEKHAYGNTLRRLIESPIKVDEVRFEQYVQSRPRRYSKNVVVLGGGSWYCGLRNEHVALERLPLNDCFGCPNLKCREFTLKLSEEGDR